MTQADSGAPDATLPAADAATDAGSALLDAPASDGAAPTDGAVIDAPYEATNATEVDAASPDGDAADGASDDSTDASSAGDGTCDLGSAANFATDQTLSVFGTPTYFEDGGSLPAGEYRVTYLDGCMMYGSGQGWTVNAYDGDPDSWWLIGATTSDRIVVPPGTVGYAPGAGAYANFGDCVTASQMVPPVDFYFDGGPIGVWLQDSPYTDNTAGPDGGNPRWELTLLGNCSLVSQ
jgi:hypothetical protein